MELLSKFRTIFSGASGQDTDRLPPERYLSERRRHPRRNPRSNLNVVVIDDSPTVCAALRKMLESNGLKVHVAGDAESGLAMVQAAPPDLIFLDIVLPRMNGFAALRQLRRDAQTRHVPVIMVSGNELAAKQFSGSAIGADDFMGKPFSRPDVFGRIERLLDSQQVPRRQAAFGVP